MFCLRSTSWFYLITTTIVVVIDQITKKLAIAKIGFGNEAEFIPGFMRFFLVQNTGGAFSLLRDYPDIFLFIGIINIAVFIHLLFGSEEIFLVQSKIGCSFILGGTLGNFTDRITFGAVTDFLDFQFMDFAVFNVADVCIDIGVVFLIYGLFMQERAQKTVKQI